MARLLLSALSLTALIGYFIFTLGVAGFYISYYFGYFTVQSGIVGCVVFLLAGLRALRTETDPVWLDMLRVSVTTYILVSGVVYALITFQPANVAYAVSIPWSSQILHFWIPALAVIDWFVDPDKARLPWKNLGLVLVFPVFWLIFTLVRGDLIGWYPYFFLDARLVSGPLETFIYYVLIVVIITGIAALLTAATRMKPHRFHPRMSVLGQRSGRVRAATTPNTPGDAPRDAPTATATERPGKVRVR
ncbi:hypothetical protein D6T64_07120 [Cryobacterium melibiosiphilum]|uniref:Pr6Pr family membrane protein n=1 Tax=Cryobacterium melibiosiphilum TaxID=995039 RepID=A0A3A5MQS3_9MICO|nr:hypothetical protein D6T64_07120 [Cryobacterium melibiosiphilum]